MDAKKLLDLLLSSIIYIREALQKCNDIKPLLKPLTTGDEKWIQLQCVNEKNAPQSVAKPELVPEKAILRVW